jgi:hypothetical protein
LNLHGRTEEHHAEIWYPFSWPRLASKASRVQETSVTAWTLSRCRCSWEEDSEPSRSLKVRNVLTIWPWPDQSTCTTLRVMIQYNIVMSLARLGTKNNCAGEDQQQFIRLAGQPLILRYSGIWRRVFWCQLPSVRAWNLIQSNY